VDKNLLLTNETARLLYFDYAKDLPCIDYHNHLSPRVLAEDTSFCNMTHLWLAGDHYKWRAMRALGVDERFITGDAPDEDKFVEWGNCMPMLLRNPLFHWSQMELANPFGIHEYLDGKSAGSMYKRCNELLQTDGFRPQALMKRFNVELLGTTDDPADDLRWHSEIRKSSAGFTVTPTFRPDRVLNLSDTRSFFSYLQTLGAAARADITDLDSLLIVCLKRIEYFHQHGCRISDHGLQRMPPPADRSTRLEAEFKTLLVARPQRPPEWAEEFQGWLLTELCREYHRRGWVQQFHLGALRNVNSRMFNTLGADAGTDCMGDEPQAARLAAFLNSLDKTNQLGKTILYPISPSHFESFATIAGSFNEGPAPGKVQFGSAWWFMDQQAGIERQINALSSVGVMSTFVGMTTDSRSFLSFSRHDYFRRVLCNLLGGDMENGLLPNDLAWIGGVVKKVCYENARAYFQ
jgi:glucuronate isomerase